MNKAVCFGLLSQSNDSKDAKKLKGIVRICQEITNARLNSCSSLLLHYTVWGMAAVVLVGNVSSVPHPSAPNDCNYQCCYNNCWMLNDLYCHMCAPEIRTGSSSLMVFMELTSICLCSWCVNSCCLSSIIFDILVIPEENRKYTLMRLPTSKPIHGFSNTFQHLYLMSHW